MGSTQGGRCGRDGVDTVTNTPADLRALDLVVISVCQGGLGDGISGEGVVSLQTAFHQAGVRTDVASLWQVRDDVTQELMTDFYTDVC